MIITMKMQKIIVIVLLFLVVIGFKPSIGARLLDNGLLISLENPSAFDPKLNSVIQVTGTSSGSGSGSEPFKDPREKNRLPCGEPRTLTFRLKENGIVVDKMKEAPNSEEVVLDAFAKGSVTPSGGSERGNNGIRSAQRLAKSNHSPGVGHLQIFNTPKSPQKGGVSDIQDQQRMSKKRILKSSPSPGGGH